MSTIDTQLMPVLHSVHLNFADISRVLTSVVSLTITRFFKVTSFTVIGNVFSEVQQHSREFIYDVP